MRTAGSGPSFLEGRHRETMAGMDSQLGLLGEVGDKEDLKKQMDKKEEQRLMEAMRTGDVERKKGDMKMEAGEVG